MGFFVFPQPIVFSPGEVKYLNKTLSTLGGVNNFDQWMRAHGGIDAGAVDIQLTLVGNRPQGITIEDMTAVGPACTTPLTGAAVMGGTEGSEPSIPIGFNLDQPGPDAQAMNDNGRFGPDYFEFNTVSLPYNQRQTFEISGITEKHYCQFSIRVKMLLGNHGPVVYQNINDGGSPFKVTALMPGYSYKIEYGTGIATSPCLGRPGVPAEYTLFGMIKPHVFCAGESQG